MGTATYTGGAAGHYALHSSTGGTNDAGQFTARAKLQANFTDDTVSGAIDGFVGADGEARNWSVELKEASVVDVGEVATGGPGEHVLWTIDGVVGAIDPENTSPHWIAQFRDNGDDGVPQSATGVFRAHFGAEGQMLGAFGVNKQ